MQRDTNRPIRWDGKVAKWDILAWEQYLKYEKQCREYNASVPKPELPDVICPDCGKTTKPRHLRNRCDECWRQWNLEVDRQVTARIAAADRRLREKYNDMWH